MAIQNAINLTATGMIAHDGAGVFSGRTITAGSGISVANGDGTGGNPTISADADVPTTFDGDSGSATPAANTITIAGGTGITTAGAGSTITVTLDTPVAETDGGTGQSTYTTGDILYASGANTLAKLAVGSNTEVLTLAGGVPTWAAPTVGTVTSVSGTANRITSTGGATPVIDIAATYVGQSSITTLGTIGTGTWEATDVAVAHGGTGRSSHTAYAVICGGTTTTGAQQSIASVGTSGQVLTSNGAGALPTFQTATDENDWVLIDSQSASSSASLEFDLDASKYYCFTFRSIRPATNDVDFSFETSSDGGSTWRNTQYFGSCLWNEYNSATQTMDSQTTYAPLGVGVLSSSEINGVIWLTSTESAAFMSHGTSVWGRVSGGRMATIMCSRVASTMNAIRFLFRSGNISIGQISQYELLD